MAPWTAAPPAPGPGTPRHEAVADAGMGAGAPVGASVEAGGAVPADAPRPGLYGKLAARGDFIARDLPRAVQRPLEAWLAEVTEGAKAALGPGFAAAWAAAPVWRFWIGPGLMGGHVVSGALVASADRVGRRHPLALVLADLPDGPGACLPPVLAPPDPGWDTAAAAALRAARSAPDLDAALARLTGLPLPPGAGADAGLPTALVRAPQRLLWAEAAPAEVPAGEGDGVIDGETDGEGPEVGSDPLTEAGEEPGLPEAGEAGVAAASPEAPGEDTAGAGGPGQDVGSMAQEAPATAEASAGIWADLAAADHLMAAAGRSYWWAGGRVLALDGLPDAGAFAVMLTTPADGDGAQDRGAGR